jgi:outer membrane scaffolding protein for murein synthesis (MipA/OmpV family)
MTATTLKVSTALFLTLPLRAILAQEPTGQHGNWQGSVGMVAGSVASYYGSDARRTLGAPLLGLVYKNRLLIGTNASGGLGGGVAWLVKQGTVGASLGLAGVESRPEDHADVLAGMDDRSGSAFGTASFSVRGGPVTAISNTLIGLSSDAGNMEMLGLQLGGPITSRLSGSIGGTVTLADRKNMEFDFGITDEQAARRRKLIDAGDGRLRDGDATAFAPKGGFKELRSTVQLAYAIRGAWQVVGVVSEGRLAHNVAESPLVRKRDALTTAAGLAYRF